MPGIVIRWLITTLAIMAVPYVISGVQVKGFFSALLASAILGILNALVRPLLIILTLPLTIVTIGLFIFVINALLFQFAAALVPGMHVDSFWSALLASLIVSIVSWLLNSMIAGGAGETTVIVRHGEHVVDMRQDRNGKWQ
ncbi:MAG: phage holin family protein [Desulfomonile tiedjei]|nr:phage holin family protein [Desulfomonile tiedjei]